MASRKSSAKRVFQIASSCGAPFSEYLASRPKPFDALHSFSELLDSVTSTFSMPADSACYYAKT